ncbi:MAG: hypothetical protein EXR77_05655 [Myxococcales bacterium]|nr:hypothetical protein [Myxococcales bacterium]
MRMNWLPSALVAIALCAVAGCVDSGSTVVSTAGATAKSDATTATDGAAAGSDAAAQDGAAVGSDGAGTGSDGGGTGSDGSGTGSDGSGTGSDGSGTGSDGSGTGTDAIADGVSIEEAGAADAATDDGDAPTVSDIEDPDGVTGQDTGAETSYPDVASAEATVPDGNQPDDVTPDTGVPDTATPDTVAPDTNPPADTNQPVDTNPPADVPVSPCGPAGCDDGNPCTVDTCKADGLCVWATQANTPCEDGDKCTTGDVCQGLLCKAGSGKAVCDDKNPCTTDSCGAASGCIFAPNTATCDDGDKCTLQDACSASACKGTQNACEDGKPCTDDACNKVSGDCSWTGKSGACNDGNPCTVNESCKTGQCAGGEVKVCDDKEVCTTDSCDVKVGCVNAAVATGGKCDDGSACTANDACANGKCTGPAPSCNDGNACTTDGCDPKTGQCTLTSNTLPCQAGDKCQTPGTCKNGQCAASGAPKVCNDTNPCTADSCDPATGACMFKAANDGAVCDDAIACTKESVCVGGGCKPKVGCLLFSDTFECASNPTFAVVVPPPTAPNPPRKVVWAVDQTPIVNALAGMGCMLNFNDGVDYCDQIGFNDGTQQCQFPVGTATSPVLDFSAVGGLLPRVTFDTYYDVDNTSATDSPRIRVIEEATKTELKNVLLPKNSGDLKALKKGYVISLPEAAGKKVRLELSLQPSTSNSSLGNTGAGWFIDNFVVEAITGAVEVCGNGFDDNFNGLVDCADSACSALAVCAENCGDTIDNNKNGLTDCADPVCVQSVACKTPFASVLLETCVGDGWTLAAATGGVAWAVDATPNIGPLPFGKCTLNFNNGVNYCTNMSCQNADTVSGIATFKTGIDLPAGKKIAIALQAWLSTENPETGNGATYDNTWIEVSSNNFACNNTNNCPSQNNPYTAGGTVSYQLPRDKLKVWVIREFDASTQAGKKVTLRVRFSSGDGQYNDFAGPFVDEFKFYAQ